MEAKLTQNLVHPPYPYWELTLHQLGLADTQETEQKRPEKCD